MEDVEYDWPLLHHHAFLLGDLNYRIAMAPDEAITATASAMASGISIGSNWSTLHQADELTSEMAGGRVMCGFVEGGGQPPHFPPTYRRVRGGNPGSYTKIEQYGQCYMMLQSNMHLTLMCDHVGCESATLWPCNANLPKTVDSPTWLLAHHPGVIECCTILQPI